ncbi:DMT family transporter, partial [Saccharomonospora saliphila]|uniref:DMT family transporter n=1 Tax=Saccharomonospora saliphila TaxID=369829 RepID=UPI000376F6FE
MSVQSRINGQLGTELGDAVLAAVISFGGGLLILLALLPISARMRKGLGRAGSALRTGGLRPWHFLGGLAGATYVLGQSVTVVLIGVAMFTVGVVAGQTVSGLVVDKVGIGPAGRQAPSWPRVLGAVLTVVAVAGAVGG